jgi:hypothetical protein
MVELGRGRSLLFREFTFQSRDYPTYLIQKGGVLVFRNNELAEEGLGFGVPLLKDAHEVVFPGCAQISVSKDGKKSIVEANYSMNLVQSMVIAGKRIDSPVFYKIKESFSPMYRKCAPLRQIGTWASSRLRLARVIGNRFENIASRGTVGAIYVIRDYEDTVQVSMDLSRLNSKKTTEIIIANEQGADYFDHYSDSDGTNLMRKAIGIWNEVFADEASFVDSRNGIEFKLRKMKGAKMFRGWELVARRLAWSGLNYLLPQDTVTFTYDIRIGMSK